jgi:hypothetical protein
MESSPDLFSPSSRHLGGPPPPFRSSVGEECASRWTFFDETSDNSTIYGPVPKLFVALVLSAEKALVR